MRSPIKLYFPNYYNEQTFDGNRFILTKTKPLLKEDTNNAKIIASIEKVDNYQCRIPEIGEEYQKIATNCFHRDRENEWELPIKICNCKVYTYNWDDPNFHFRIYWIVISEKIMLQVLGFFEPPYSDFYKKHFMTYIQDVEIDTTYKFSISDNPAHIFTYEPVNIAIEDLQELIDDKKQKAGYEDENLKITNPNFYTILEKELKEKDEVSIENFICTDWNMYYDLYNPENFSDPDSTIEWEDNTDVYTYYEKPYTNNSKVKIVCNEKHCNLNALKNLVKNKDKVEHNLLSFFEHYTFGNGGAYASGIHFKWAKIEIERLHNTTYTNKEFLKQNLCLQDIILSKNANEIKLYFKCSWDTENGIEVEVNNNFECEIAK